MGSEQEASLPSGAGASYTSHDVIGVRSLTHDTGLRMTDEDPPGIVCHERVAAVPSYRAVTRRVRAWRVTVRFPFLAILHYPDDGLFVPVRRDILISLTKSGRKRDHG
ncbi:hypothetical protein LX15_003274 [Streptoalloteichus tenebrarius]|uniref:Uncharacterized protein n=1 Tax=Streptoalloteichus tenebrarius (strain ATCC 17920 / DSM 40477 / JCM 4838 / CBS 697.72 / NBRC 16177 / NCIMB 11028 / NRRL B-12390 / A12253. 1 / ISP 5477) TaxID=1933 RepID=A0ABT1HVL7_STRSD|nr:hypothetical protein [Streptoalloteichus tenebrarius]BFF01024.1 hypothetical protein GCM10020241_26990 [Streptoalloteichus tenebrarius]